jgi:signal transduction histidine kinase/CheY-like chemotaxis protein
MLGPVRTPSVLLRRQGALLLTVAAGVSLSLLLFLVMRRGETRELQSAFEAVARQRVELLREGLTRSLSDVHALGALFNTGLEIDRETFRRFVSPALDGRSDLQALAWAPRVPAAARDQVEAAIRTQGHADFTFTRRNQRTRLPEPAAERDDDYYPILFVEPFERNRSAFGLVIGNPTGSTHRARDAGHAVASVLMPLALAPDHAPGLIVNFPVYDGPVPDTLEERRARFRGFVAGYFLVGELFEPALASLQGVRVTVRDVVPDPRSILFHPQSQEDAPPSRRLIPRTFELHTEDRALEVTFTPTTAFGLDRRQWGAWTTLICGMLLTGLTGCYVASWQRRTSEVARANAALQAEIFVRKQAEEAAAAANRAKTSFVTHLSHEIRTPLNSILGYAQILERDRTLPERDRDAVSAIAASGRHLLGLLNSVLDLSRIEAGHAELHRVAFDLPALVDSLAQMFQPRCAEKGLSLRLECHVPNGRGSVLGDDGKLRQVLINLVGNAIKFTHRGEVLVRVSNTKNDVWRFEVVDTGVGCTEHERLSLFRPFYQTTEGSRAGGSGLGLAIARGHVQLMGGRLDVESRRGNGTRFHFELVLPAAVVSTDHRLTGDLPRLAPGQRVHALVIDDSRDNRRILARLLADMGCAVAQAGTARGARDVALQARPDVVFLDVFLAETTGPELLLALRADGLPEQVPVVLHTAALLTREQQEELRACGVALLQKPFRVEELVACLERVPGVHLESAPLPRPAGNSDRAASAAPSHAPSIPGALAARLGQAAEFHNVTAIKECLVELRGIGDDAEALAEQLGRYVRCCDFGAIKAAVLGLRRDVATETSPVGAH